MYIGTTIGTYLLYTFGMEGGKKKGPMEGRGSRYNDKQI